MSKKETVVLVKVDSTATSKGVNTLKVETLPPDNLGEHDHFHPETQTFKINKGEPNYKEFEDEEIIEMVFRKKA